MRALDEAPCLAMLYWPCMPVQKYSAASWHAPQISAKVMVRNVTGAEQNHVRSLL